MEDIERWRSFKVDYAAKFFMISWMMASYAIQMKDTRPIVYILFVVLFMKADGRARALMLASNSVMQKNYRCIADYMSTEHDPSNEDPTTMRGYRYLVSVPKEATTAKCRQKATSWRDEEAPQYRQSLEVTDEVITVEKVWNCEGWLLSVSGGDRDGRLKDLCLSFSLFKFICLRFTGYPLPGEAHGKLRRLIQHMLSQQNGHERVFQVIELELAFLFDLFYTKYPVNLHRCRSIYGLLLLPIVVFLPSILLFVAIRSDFVFFAIPHFLLVISIVVGELTQFGMMIFSEWAKVTYICKYVRNGRWRRNICFGKLIKMMCRVQLVNPWGRQLHQYSLLTSYSYTPCKCIYNRFTAAYLNQKRDGQQLIAPTNLSEQVKKAIARSLGYCTGNLESGQASLRCNDSLRRNDLLVELSWACDLETTTHVIMVWHIATSFCEYKCARLPKEQRDNFGVAIELSQYLAYLVVFAPKLLPGNPCRIEYIFSRVVSEARGLFGGSSASVEERIQKLKMVIDDGDGQYGETIVGLGARLGMQLLNEVVDEDRIWKVLADFWAELMLYVAPSNDPAAHAKYLTTGGELVTHVWVLVSHAGIMRDPRGSEQHDDPERN